MIDEDYRFKLACEIHRRRKFRYCLSGNTFPVRDKIRQQGGLWDAGAKCWLMPNLATIHIFTTTFDNESGMYIIPYEKKGAKDDAEA